MRLVKLSYITPEWELNNLVLTDVNLIVAKNATGKSRTLLALNLLVQTITQKTDLDRAVVWELEFIGTENTLINYTFSIIKSGIKYVVDNEQLQVDSKTVLNRNMSLGSLEDITTKQSVVVSPPPNKLILHSNRDTKKYPYLEWLVMWADNSYGLRFGNIMPYSNFNLQYSNLLNQIEDTPSLFKSLNKKEQRTVIDLINTTGYNISEIIITGNESLVLNIKEVGIDNTIPQRMIAQGLYRNLSLIIKLVYLLSKNKPEMIIIDDLCEGLDYERAKKLGGLIFDKCLKENVQLVATSNDSFLMDVVDIKYWNILIRVGKVVNTLNYSKNKKLFDEFKFTGLSNFDFFSSDFIKHGIT